MTLLTIFSRKMMGRRRFRFSHRSKDRESGRDNQTLANVFSLRREEKAETCRHVLCSSPWNVRSSSWNIRSSIVEYTFQRLERRIYPAISENLMPRKEKNIRKHPFSLFRQKLPPVPHFFIPKCGKMFPIVVFLYQVETKTKRKWN